MNKKIERNICVAFWMYCTVLITFNELIGLFVSKTIMRAGYIILMALFFWKKLYKNNFIIRISRIDRLVLLYSTYVFFRGLFQVISGNLIVGSAMTWVQNWIPILAYFIARDLKSDERKTIEYLFASLAAISVTMGFLNSKVNFLPQVGAFAGGLYADAGNGALQIRGYSMAGIALITGFICGYSLCCLLDLNIDKKRKAVLFVVNLLGCLYSLSRGALAFVIISFGVYFFIRFFQNKQLVSRRAGITITLILLIGIAIVWINLEKITSSVFFGRFVIAGMSRAENSNLYRANYQRDAIRSFMQSPILGKGYGFTGYQAISAGIKETINTESYILSLSISAGTIGLLLFLAITIISLKRFDKHFTKYACTIIGMFAWSVMYILLDSDLIGLFFWYCIGILGRGKEY